LVHLGGCWPTAKTPAGGGVPKCPDVRFEPAAGWPELPSPYQRYKPNEERPVLPEMRRPDPEKNPKIVAIAAHQTQTGPVQATNRQHPRQGHDHAAVLARLDHLSAHCAVKVDDHPRTLGVAAKADAHHLAHRARGKAPTSGQRGDAEDDEGHGRHRPLADTPLR
jgi:hypothetical protein